MRMENRSNVIGTVIVNAQGIPIRSTLNNSMTVQYARLVHNLSAMARSMVRVIDPQKDFIFLRICSNKNEIMVGLDDDYLLIVIQKRNE